MAHVSPESLPAAELRAELSAELSSAELARDAGAPPAGAEPAADEAHVHAAGTFDKGLLRWGYFLLLNAIAASIAVTFFISMLYADGLDPYLAGTYEWLLAHPGVTSALAFSPLACSLLVGYGYASRARKRKKLAAARAARAAADGSVPSNSTEGAASTSGPGGA
jgi:hypothetical protein